MLAIRHMLKSNTNIIKNVTQQRNMSAISGPSRNKVSKGETLVLAAAMLIGWTIVPAWVLVNVKHYRDRD